MALNLWSNWTGVTLHYYILFYVTLQVEFSRLLGVTCSLMCLKDIWNAGCTPWSPCPPACTPLEPLKLLLETVEPVKRLIGHWTYTYILLYVYKYIYICSSLILYVYIYIFTCHLQQLISLFCKRACVFYDKGKYMCVYF